jgi:Nucleotidyl transferase of unknown function (DUF2204)
MTASTATAVRAIHGEVNANEFHRRPVAALHAAEVPFLIGGAYMVEVCGGVSRSTKDFDLYVRPNHVKAALRALARAGYKIAMTFPHWLAKATYEGDIVDLIFRAGNGLCEVDDSWFDRARDDKLLGVPVKLCAPEEMIWMKAYIMERERFDGADIAHILRCCAAEIDWPHLVLRFGPDWRVLLSHLILFGYIDPRGTCANPGGDHGRFDDTAPERSESRRARTIMPQHAAFAGAVFGGRTGMGISGRTFGRTCSDERERHRGLDRCN